jgi:RNA polymerase sigma-70 factor (ECF subfamily)
MEAHQSAVYNLCYRMLGSSPEAEDAAQEAFLRAYDQFGRYDPSRSFKTWLLAIAHHYCIDRLRRRRGVSLDIDDQVLAETLTDPAGGDDPECRALLSEQQHDVQALLARLAPDDRAAIVMRYWYALSYAEIAEVTRSSVSAVKSRLHRARAVLATMIEPEPHASHPGRVPAVVASRLLAPAAGPGARSGSHARSTIGLRSL